MSLPDRERRLRDLLAPLRERFDFILIDTPPSLGLLTLNALVAADAVIIPLNCEYFALEGLADLVATLRRVRAALNPSLDIAGVLMTMYDERTNLGQQVARDIREFFKDRVFDTVIPRNVRLGEAPSHGLPAILYDVKSRGSEAYLALAQRAPRARVGRRRARQHGATTMVEKRPALGRGLSALIPDTPAPARRDAPNARSTSTPICCGRTSSSRARTWTTSASRSSSRSIRANGIIQPIIVRKVEQGFEIVAGERRWRAAQRAGLLKVPVVVRDIPEDRLLAVALIENIQREDLNPIEEALAYRRLADEFHLTQEQIADAVGKDRSSIANYVRLLRLPQEVRANVASDALSMGHARALLALADEDVAAPPRARHHRAQPVGARDRGAGQEGGRAGRREARDRQRRPHACRGRQAPARAGHARAHHAQRQGRPNRDRLRQRRRTAAPLRAADGRISARHLGRPAKGATGAGTVLRVRVLRVLQVRRGIQSAGARGADGCRRAL